MATTITVTGTPQAGYNNVTVSGTGYSSGQVLALLISDPEYGSNMTTPDGTAVTQARRERTVKCDTTGAFTTTMVFPFAKQYSLSTRDIKEQWETTTASATATTTPTQANT